MISYSVRLHYNLLQCCLSSNNILVEYFFAIIPVYACRIHTPSPSQQAQRCKHYAFPMSFLKFEQSTFTSNSWYWPILCHLWFYWAIPRIDPLVCAAYTSYLYVNVIYLFVDQRLRSSALNRRSMRGWVIFISIYNASKCMRIDHVIDSDLSKFLMVYRIWI